MAHRTAQAPRATSYELKIHINETNNILKISTFPLDHCHLLQL